MAKIYTYNKAARNRISRSVNWTERNQTVRPPDRNRPQTPSQIQVAIVEADMEHGVIGEVSIAEGNDLESSLIPGDPVSDVYNPLEKIWAGSQVLIQQGALAGALPESSANFQIIKAFSATRIRGLAAADIDPQGTGTIGSTEDPVETINGHFAPQTAEVYLPTSFVKVHQGLMVWAELRFNPATGLSRWEAYSSDCNSDNTQTLAPDPVGDVAWDGEEGGDAYLELTDPNPAVRAPGQTLTLQMPTNVKAGDLLTLTVQQDTEGSHVLAYEQGKFFFPYGEPSMATNPGAVELLNFRAFDSAGTLGLVGWAPPNMNPVRQQVNPNNLRFLTASDAVVQNTGKGPTITNGANALDGSAATYCTLVQDTIVQNASQEWAVQISFLAPQAVNTISAIAMGGASFVTATRYPNNVQIYLYSGPNGTGDVVSIVDAPAAVYWPSGVMNEETIFILLTPYQGPFQSAEFWFSFNGRNDDVSDITFSRAAVIDY